MAENGPARTPGVRSRAASCLTKPHLLFGVYNRPSMYEPESRAVGFINRRRFITLSP
jgi:hypothetical protein